MRGKIYIIQNWINKCLDIRTFRDQSNYTNVSKFTTVSLAKYFSSWIHPNHLISHACDKAENTHTHDSKTQVFPTCTDEISEVLSRNTHIVKVDVRILREVWVHVSGAVVRSHAPVITCFMLSTIGNYTWLREREVRIRLCATGSYQHIQLNCANRITCQSLHVCDLILRFMLGQLN